jgi:hypothetical protein
MKKLLNLLIQALAKKEGKRVELNAGQLREVMACLKKVIKEDQSLLKYLVG